MPVIRNLILPVRQAWTKINDFLLGIDTSAPTRGRSQLGIADFNRYEGVEYWYAYKVLRLINPGQEDVICDIGCGKGRFLCLAARYPIRRAIGVELQAELCEITLRNASTLRGRKAPVEVLCADCTKAALPDDVTIYFMFNPFGSETMKATVQALGESWHRSSRRVRIVYYNDRCAHVLDSSGWLRKTQVLNTLFGGTISFWESPKPIQDASERAGRT